MKFSNLENCSLNIRSIDQETKLNYLRRNLFFILVRWTDSIAEKINVAKRYASDILINTWRILELINYTFLLLRSTLLSAN